MVSASCAGPAAARRPNVLPRLLSSDPTCVRARSFRPGSPAWFQPIAPGASIAGAGSWARLCCSGPVLQQTGPPRLPKGRIGSNTQRTLPRARRRLPDRPADGSPFLTEAGTCRLQPALESPGMQPEGSQGSRFPAGARMTDALPARFELPLPAAPVRSRRRSSWPALARPRTQARLRLERTASAHQNEVVAAAAVGMAPAGRSAPAFPFYEAATEMIPGPVTIPPTNLLIKRLGGKLALQRPLSGPGLGANGSSTTGCPTWRDHTSQPHALGPARSPWLDTRKAQSPRQGSLPQDHGHVQTNTLLPLACWKAWVRK